MNINLKGNPAKITIDDILIAVPKLTIFNNEKIERD